ncbi:hypothetical protein [Xanthovirga aplysinae]|uniref:hypothetical protein n=1 Tax=Xanthovirga aplysinae TaxID=2529853 RepID=UPI00165728B1|nr:hypothetical protein [Xanthovirga aplysinae]
MIFEYKYDVLREKKNKKYAKKESKKGIKVVGVKITNNTGQALTYNEDLKLFSAGYAISPIEPQFVYGELKQGVPIYLLYLLLTPSKFNYWESENGVVKNQSSFPIGLILGPGISGGNMLVAGTANQNFLKELKTKNLIGKEIKNGETVSGLIGMRNMGYAPLELKVIESTVEN